MREQLSRTATQATTDARAALGLTGGNPLFVREVARAMADGTGRPDRLPPTVLDVVSARLDRVSTGCRRLVQAVAIVGREFSLVLVAATLDEPAHCFPLIDEAIACGLLDRVGDIGDHRFVHALTRDAVEASLRPPTGLRYTAPPLPNVERTQSPELMGEAALVLEAAPSAGVNAVAKQLCEEALVGLGNATHQVCAPGCWRNTATSRSTTRAGPHRAPAMGVYFGLQCALAGHVGLTQLRP